MRASRLFSALLVLGLCLVTGTAKAESCDPQEAGGLLVQAGENDPAFKGLVERLMRLGYTAESTCITARVQEPGADPLTSPWIYTIEQQLGVHPLRHTVPAADPQKHPHYKITTRVSLDPKTTLPLLLEFTVQRRLSAG